MVWSFIGISDDSQENLIEWIGIAMMSSIIVGTTVGLLFSTAIRNDINALITAMMWVSFQYFGSGFFANIGGSSNYLLDFFNVISPISYSTKAMMLCFIKGLK